MAGNALSLVEWSVIYARKNRGHWQKGASKATLSIHSDLRPAKLIVRIHDRTWEQLELSDGTPLVYSLIETQIRFLVNEESRQFALQFNSSMEASHCRSILENYTTSARQTTQAQQTLASQPSQETQQETAMEVGPSAVSLVVETKVVEDKFLLQRQELTDTIKRLLSDVSFKEFVKLVEEIVQSDPTILESNFWQ